MPISMKKIGVKTIKGEWNVFSEPDYEYSLVLKELSGALLIQRRAITVEVAERIGSLCWQPCKVYAAGQWILIECDP